MIYITHPSIIALPASVFTATAMEFQPLLLLLLLCISPATSQYEIADQDLNGLRQLKDSLTDIKHDKNAFFRSWDFYKDPCTTFAGVRCKLIDDHFRVAFLQLGNDSSGLAGTISDTGLYNLTELISLELYPGIVTGNIPSEIGHRLPNLHSLTLPNNRLTGTIPESLFDLQNLQSLNLGHNDLTGKIPETLYQLPKLSTLILENNNLEGEILEVSDQSELVALMLGNNMLIGDVPPTIPASLGFVSLANNRIASRLYNLRPLPNLEKLDLSFNLFYGPLPDNLLRPSLDLFLQHNSLSGHLPDSVVSAAFTPQSTVDLSHNFLTGEIPDYLSGVGYLFLDNNEFTGKIPGEMIHNVFTGRINALYLQRNFLTAFPFKETGNMVLPEGVDLCLTYNCMHTPALGLSTCPPSVGGPFVRPAKQCSAIPP